MSPNSGAGGDDQTATLSRNRPLIEVARGIDKFETGMDQLRDDKLSREMIKAIDPRRGRNRAPILAGVVGNEQDASARLQPIAQPGERCFAFRLFEIKVAENSVAVDEVDILTLWLPFINVCHNRRHSFIQRQSHGRLIDIDPQNVVALETEVLLDKSVTAADADYAFGAIKPEVLFELFDDPTTVRLAPRRWRYRVVKRAATFPDLVDVSALPALDEIVVASCLCFWHSLLLEEWR